MEKKVPINDIYPLIGKTIKDTYNEIDRLLGDKNPFASIGIGTGFLVWKDARRNWQQMIAASDVEQEAIRATKYELKKELSPILGEENAEKLFTTPDDSYIYYDYDGGDIKILITGWGYEKPVRHNVKPDIEGIEMPNPISISFVHDGQILANYAFGIQLPKQVKRLYTSLDGVYRFTNLKVGAQCTLIDLKSGKRFLLKVVQGQAHYDFDITSYCQLTIRVRHDEMSSAGEVVDVVYDDKAYQLITDSNGEASLKLTYHANSSISATARGENRVVLINENGNTITFSFESPKPVNVDIEVVVVCDNQPVANKSVAISYGDQSINGTTDDYGRFSHHTTIIPDKSCYVIADGYDAQQRILCSSISNVFVFNKGSDAPYRLLILSRDGEVCSRYSVYMEHNEQNLLYKSDDNGVILLPRIEDGCEFVVTDASNCDNISMYRFSKQQQEYIFYVDDKPAAKDIKLTILDYYQRPISCREVSLDQGTTGTAISINLDSEGSALFSEKTFTKYQDITANIVNGDREFNPIVFHTEDDEYEYVLQEEKPKLMWKTVLLQLAVLMALMLVLGLAWVLFEVVGEKLFDIIYN